MRTEQEIQKVISDYEKDIALLKKQNKTSDFPSMNIQAIDRYQYAIDWLKWVLQEPGKRSKAQSLQLPSDQEIERSLCPDLETQREGWKRGAKAMKKLIKLRNK